MCQRRGDATSALGDRARGRRRANVPSRGKGIEYPVSYLSDRDSKLVVVTFPCEWLGCGAFDISACTRRRVSCAPCTRSIGTLAGSASPRRAKERCFCVCLCCLLGFEWSLKVPLHSLCRRRQDGADLVGLCSGALCVVAFFRSSRRLVARWAVYRETHTHTHTHVHAARAQVAAMLSNELEERASREETELARVPAVQL